MPAMLSATLSVAAFVATSHREVSNELPEKLLPNARRAAALWDQVTPRIPGGLMLTSGYRSPALNKAIGGSPISAHLDARAWDSVPMAYGLVSTMLEVQNAMADGLEVDKAIIEGVRGRHWLHIQVAPLGEKPRRLCLMTFDGVAFAAWDPQDPRVGSLA